ncbi:DUF6165 family protein [Pinisolibacter sp.]|jgi:hypothetical protein|uniref:DUF6165 family protein n=1 Tax=Pinisolibacter sp. TaxID=2172024 RepID=UPI002FDEF949
MIEVPVAWGELVDKITILEIKSERIADPAKLANVSTELRLLRERLGDVERDPEVARLHAALKGVNETLWQIEDDIRDCERDGDFGAKFVELARSVYRTNDRRAELKREINLALGSAILEEKSYKPY